MPAAAVAGPAAAVAVSAAAVAVSAAAVAMHAVTTVCCEWRLAPANVALRDWAFSPVTVLGQ